jgi:Zn-dependent peptidase ImmA (M78 family)
VVFALVPELKGCRAHGATRWLSPRRALIQLSFRYRTDDHFWFTFFHEAAHILLHRKRAIFLEADEHEGNEEEEANRFAADFLVPPQHLEGVTAESLSKQFIVGLADDIGVSPGIVAGRLQHDGLIPYSRYADLRVRIDWELEEDMKASNEQQGPSRGSTR